MSSLDAMFEGSSVYFQYVNEPAAHVKIDQVPVGVDLGCSKFLYLLLSGGFRLLGFYELKSKGFGSIRMIF